MSKISMELHKLRIWSNLNGLDRIRTNSFTVFVDVYPRGRKNILDLIRDYIKSYQYDYLLLNTPPVDLFVFALLKYIIPFNSCKYVSMDCILPVPKGTVQRIKAMILGVLFRQVDLYIEYFKNTEGYKKYYYMIENRFRYVPFKVNRIEAILKKDRYDHGYVFCGGNTRRDFQTLLEAAKGLKIPFKIVTMPNEIIMKHGSYLDDSMVPENVEVIRHDGSESFIDYIAGSRLVVLPIKKKNISASGIGVYLASMALGKCVVISSGVGVDEILTEGQAYIVPPEDPGALREAIMRLYDDHNLRDKYAQKGMEYAMRLGGEDRLAESALDILIEDRKNA